jgi:hypothetical protein
MLHLQPTHVPLVMVGASDLRCGVDDVVIFVGLEGRDVPLPLESQVRSDFVLSSASCHLLRQALYQIASFDADRAPVESSVPAPQHDINITVRFLGGGGRIAINDGEITTPAHAPEHLHDVSPAFSMIKIQVCRLLGRFETAAGLFLFTPHSPPPLHDYVMFWGDCPPYLLSCQSSVFKVCSVSESDGGGYQFSVLPVEGARRGGERESGGGEGGGEEREAGGRGGGEVGSSGHCIFGFARAVSFDAIYRNSSFSSGGCGRDRLMTVEIIDQRRKNDKNASHKSKQKRRRKDFAESPPPYCDISSRVYLRSSVLLSPHIQVRQK